MKAPMKILWLSAVLSLAFIACKDEAKPQTKEAPPAETVVKKPLKSRFLRQKFASPLERRITPAARC
jgi:hypothetical protein